MPSLVNVDARMTVSRNEFNNLIEQCRDMRRRACKVNAGVLKGAKTEQGEDIVEYAAYNEFGTSKIPRRPFLQITKDANLSKWRKFIANGLRGNITARLSEATARLLTATGRIMCADIQQTIMSNVPPPNSVELQAEKASRPGGGYAGTLYDKGNLAHSIEFELTDENGVNMGGVRGKA